LAREVRTCTAALPTVRPVRASSTHKNTATSMAAMAVSTVDSHTNATAAAMPATTTTSMVKDTRRRPVPAAVPLKASGRVAPRGARGGLVARTGARVAATKEPGAAPAGAAGATTAEAAAEGPPDGAMTNWAAGACCDTPHHRQAVAADWSGCLQFQHVPVVIRPSPSSWSPRRLRQAGPWAGQVRRRELQRYRQAATIRGTTLPCRRARSAPLRG